MKKRKSPNTKQSWRINEEIYAKSLRVIGQDGKQIGVLELKEALKEAKKQGLDLVEIAAKAEPPVVKIIDFGKFRYEEEKRLQKQKRGQTQSEVKEVRFSPFIGQKDYETKLSRVKKFLASGNKIRLVVKFKGRQIGSKNFGYQILTQVMRDTEEEVNVDMEPKFMGRHLTMVISPIKGLKKKG